jgi:hypothetical protein
MTTENLWSTPRGVRDENARSEREGKGLGHQEYLRIIKGGIDSEDSEGRWKF